MFPKADRLYKAPFAGEVANLLVEIVSFEFF